LRWFGSNYHLAGNTMSIATREREVFGEPLTITERAIGGLVAVIAAAGHVALGTDAVVFLYLLVVGA
jgi:hypothetical protein